MDGDYTICTAINNTTTKCVQHSAQAKVPGLELLLVLAVVAFVAVVLVRRRK